MKPLSFSLLLIALLALVTACAPVNPLLGKPPPPITGTQLQGEMRSPAEARGKIVMVYFWASYCDPCKKSFPKFQALAEQHPNDVVLLAVAVDPAEQNEDRLNAFMTAMKVKPSIPVVWDPRVVQSWPVPGVPMIVLLDRKGAVRWFFRGYTDRGLPWIADKLNQLLGEGAP